MAAAAAAAARAVLFSAARRRLCGFTERLLIRGVAGPVSFRLLVWVPPGIRLERASPAGPRAVTLS